MRLLFAAGLVAALVVATARQGTASPPRAGGASEAMPGGPAVSGTVTLGTTPHRERISLPGMATVHVEILDVSGKDNRVVRLGEESIWLATRGLPVDFRIAYDPAGIDPTHTYAVRARILDGENVLYLSTTPYYVLTRGAPDKVDVVVVPARVRVH